MRPTVSTRGYHLHCKDIPYLDKKGLLGLSTKDAAIRVKLEELLGWTDDASRYECAAESTLEVSALSEQDHALQLSRGKIGPEEDPKGTCKPLKVPEHAKSRNRAIQHPKMANSVTAKHAPVGFVPYQDRHNAILKGVWTIDLDWSAFFDQFELSREVRKYFAFKTKRGQVYSMRVLPMGLKHSVGVAHTATLQLLNFAHVVYAEAYVDNVRMVADDKEALIADAATLVVRCAEAGVTVNELDVSVLRSLPSERRFDEAKRLVAPLCKQKGPWLGEEYDYVSKELDVAEKTKEKVRACLDAKRPTFRTFAAAAGVLQYASRTLAMPLAPYYAAIRAIAAVAWLLEGRPHLWDHPLPPMCESVMVNMRKWRADILAAQPRKISTPAAPSLFIVVDASDEGWGAISVDEFGKTQFVKQKWSDRDRRIMDTRLSVRAEPEGIYRACCRFIRPAKHATVYVATDSAAAAGALSKGHSRSYWMNHVNLRLQQTFPRSLVVVRHTPGKTNPADGVSRELAEPTPGDYERAVELADHAFTTWKVGTRGKGATQDCG